MNNALPGQFRLAQIQLFNWGTFDGLHTVDIAREGFLITGPSGSGKSTLIDAVSAVLIPPSTLRFNAAADAAAKSGRDLVSYCRGAWRREHSAEVDELTQRFLRVGATWSGVALRYDDGEGHSISACRIMFLNAHAHSAADIKNLFVMLPRPVSLEEFADLAAKELNLGSAKKAFPNALALQRNHAPFITAFQRHLGIADAGALELLHRTQSAKSLGDLNSLMRKFMLPVPETFAIADQAIENFTELQSAHDMVVEARTQIEHLVPIRTVSQQLADIATELSELHDEQRGLPTFVSTWKRQFALEDEQNIRNHMTVVEAQNQVVADELKALEDKKNHIETQIHGEEGAGLINAKNARDHAQEVLERVSAAERAFSERISQIGAESPHNLEQFTELRLQLGEVANEISQHIENAQKSRDAASGEIGVLFNQRKTYEDEFAAIRKFRSAMDPRLLKARELICEATGLHVDTLPFVADLIHMDDAQAAWQGAAERVLGQFARNLVVPEEHYRMVSAVINSTHLNATLRYIRFTPQLEHSQPGRFSANSLGRKIIVREGRFHDWLQAQLSAKFDYACCETMEEFYTKRRAVTLNGQVKHDEFRHVKDDFRKIDDRSRWVLSGNVDDKIELLTKSLKALNEKLSTLENQRHTFEQRITKLHTKSVIVDRLLETKDFAEIDFRTAKITAEQAQAEVDALTDGNPKLAQLQSELRNLLVLLERKKDEAKNGFARFVKLEGQLDAACKELADANEVLEGSPALANETSERLTQRFTAFDRSIRRDNLLTLQEKVNQQLTQLERDTMTRKSKLDSQLITAMDRYLDRWPQRRGDLDAKPEWTNDFIAELDRLEADDLPRVEQRFRDMLHKTTSQQLGKLRRQIRDATSKTRSNIDIINESLSLVEFYPGTHLTIEVREAQPAIARAFVDLLDSALEGALEEGDTKESERRFLKLRAVIEAMEVSDQTTARERRLRLDTREHVKFLGVEVTADGTRGAVYDSSEGLSGGQAQKLSSFCLAAALRYRLSGLGLASASQAKNSTVSWNGEDVPKYGSIIVDEAFDRADAEFTRAAMDAFTQFGFHMILATPEKLLQTVEDYIGGVLLVECPDRRLSTTSALTIEEAQRENL